MKKDIHLHILTRYTTFSGSVSLKEFIIFSMDAFNRSNVILKTLKGCKRFIFQIKTAHFNHHLK